MYKITIFVHQNVNKFLNDLTFPEKGSNDISACLSTLRLIIKDFDRQRDDFILLCCLFAAFTI